MLLITPPVPMTLISIGLEGKLLGPWVEEARHVVEAARALDRVCLDLRGLTFADARGVELLRTLRREGIPLMGCSPLMEGLLASNEVATTAMVPSTNIARHE